jgi:DegV family protein with EDD domain
MTVRIVTDSTSDVPADLAQELDITVVPAYVTFGQNSYRDRVDIDEDTFYSRLVRDPFQPTTSVPSPEDFAAVYRSLATQTDEILSVHISSKLSGTCSSALAGARLVGGQCRIELIDSRSMGMGLMLTVIAAGREARADGSLRQVADHVRGVLPRIHNLGMADTLKYAMRSGRINRTFGTLGTALQIRALLGVRDGNVFVAGLTRTRAKALERLYEFALGFPRVKEIALGYATRYDDAQDLSDRLKTAFPGIPVYVARVGPAIGAHGGPGAMGIGVRESDASG